MWGRFFLENSQALVTQWGVSHLIPLLNLSPSHRCFFSKLVIGLIQLHTLILSTAIDSIDNIPAKMEGIKQTFQRCKEQNRVRPSLPLHSVAGSSWASSENRGHLERRLKDRQN